MILFRKKRYRLDPEAMARQAQASLDRTARQQVKVNNLTAWLNRRNAQNGFGEDFEVTLIPKEAR